MKHIDYDKLISRAVFKTPPSGIRRFFDIAAQMEDCISLGVGEPDFVTPWKVREAAINSLKEGHTYYTSNIGIPKLRKLLCRYYSEKMGVDYDMDQCLITVGASEGIDLAMRTLCDPGDEILVPDPSYTSYSPTVRFTGGVPIPLHTDADTGFKLTAETIRNAITPRTKAIVVAYPNNPTGAIMTRQELIDALAPLKDTDIIVISDEIYAELSYGEEPHCAVASLPGMYERTITISGFSKAFAMTGWRLGYLFAPMPLLREMLKVHQLTLLCASITAQEAGIAAMEDAFETDFADVRKMCREYNRRRNYIVDALNDLGLTCFNPQGAFYVFPSVEISGMDADSFCDALLARQKVAVVPGTAFGASMDKYIRISYAYSMEHLMEALKRIEAFLIKIKTEEGARVDAV